MKIYLVHNSTENRLTLDKENPSTIVVIGATSNTTFVYRSVELFYEVQDNTIFEGTTCVDYRKQDESFGDCNYKALAAHLHDIYGCYPPWMKLGWKNVFVGVVLGTTPHTHPQPLPCLKNLGFSKK